MWNSNPSNCGSSVVGLCILCGIRNKLVATNKVFDFCGNGCKQAAADGKIGEVAGVGGAAQRDG